MSSETLQKEKQQVRRNMLKKRRSLSPDQVDCGNKQLADYFCSWPLYYSSKTVMFYLAMADEPQTNHLIADAWRQGKRVCVPLLGKKYGEMAAAEITSFEDLVTGSYGLKMPNPDQANLISPASINLVVVPGVAFDRDGNRIGMGAGYYDRFLLETRDIILLGMAWECQLEEKLPSEEHDVRMQYLVTECGFITCHQQ